MTDTILSDMRGAIMLAETIEEKADATNNLAREFLNLSLNDEAWATAQDAFKLSINGGSILQEGRAIVILGNVSVNYGNFSEALNYYRQALVLFESLKDKSRMAITIGNIGRVYRGLSNYPLALESYQKALDLDQELGNKQSMTNHLGNIGNVYFILSNYFRSLEYYQLALAIAEEMDNTFAIARNIGNIGSVYLKLQDYPNALKYYQKALIYREELNDQLGIADALSNIAGAYFHMENYLLSLEYYHKSITIYKSLGIKMGLSNSYSNLGILYKTLSDYPKTLKYYKLSLSLNEEIGHKHGIAINTSGLGALYGEKNFKGYDLKQAEDYLLRSASIFEELGTRNELSDVYSVIAELYNQIGDGTRAYHYHKLFYKLEKELQSEEAKRRAELLDYERKTAERDKQIAVERAKHEATEQLLHNVLPPSIAAKMLDGTKLIAEKLDNVTVLFADIVGFTRLSQRVSPEELVEGLDMIFSEFDTLAEKHRLEKIKTIGDAYMVVCGAPIPRADHALVMATMAFEMVETIRNFKAISIDIPLEIRVGIHSGEVVAGVIGKKKFAYDLWGDAVNTASRMESHSLPGKIHVTDEFRSAFEASNAPFFLALPHGERLISKEKEL